MTIAATSPYRIVHAFGEQRKAVQAYLRDSHYMKSDGGSGQLFGVFRDDGTVAGGCLIGATTSQNQTRSLVGDELLGMKPQPELVGACLIGPTASRDVDRQFVPSISAAKKHSADKASDEVLSDEVLDEGKDEDAPEAKVLVRQIKRSHLLDSVPTTQLCESQLLRYTMQTVTDSYDKPVVFVTYADLAARNARTGLPQTGFVYTTAHMFYIGLTTSQRYCVIDHEGAARSTRQGDVTLTRKTLPKAGDIFHGENITADWKMVKLPPARIYVTVVTPSSMSRRFARKTYLAIWHAMPSHRKLAARRWIGDEEWRHFVDAGQVEPYGEPKAKHVREYDAFRPGLWEPQLMTRDAAPLYIPLVHAGNILYLNPDIEREATAACTYTPLAA